MAQQLEAIIHTHALTRMRLRPTGLCFGLLACHALTASALQFVSTQLSYCVMR